MKKNLTTAMRRFLIMESWNNRGGMKKNLAGVEIEIPMRLFNVFARWAKDHNCPRGAGGAIEEFLAEHKETVLRINWPKHLRKAA